MTPDTRKELLKQSKAHFKADMLLKGVYASNGRGFRGCSVGCHLHHIYPELTIDEVAELEGKHKRVADHYKYPEWLVLLQDTVFEGLPEGDAPLWHVQLAKTLSKTTDDYDWQAALNRVHIAILRISLTHAGDAKEAVEGVLDLHERAASGESVSDEMWSAARAAAWSASESARSARLAAESAARAAARAAAWSAAESARAAARAAAWSAAESARSAARSAARAAAWSAAESAAESAVESAAFEEMRDGILAALGQRQ